MNVEQRSGWMYVLNDRFILRNYCKIGQTRNLHTLRSRYLTVYPDHVIYIIKCNDLTLCEKEVKERLYHCRLNRSEIFEINVGEAIELLEIMCNERAEALTARRSQLMPGHIRAILP